MIIDGFPPSADVVRLEHEIASVRGQLAEERARNIELLRQLTCAIANQSAAEAALCAARGRVDRAETDALSWKDTAEHERASKEMVQVKLDELTKTDEIPSTERA